MHLNLLNLRTKYCCSVFVARLEYNVILTTLLFGLGNFFGFLVLCGFLLSFFFNETSSVWLRVWWTTLVACRLSSVCIPLLDVAVKFIVVVGGDDILVCG